MAVHADGNYMEATEVSFYYFLTTVVVGWASKDSYGDILTIAGTQIDVL